MVLPFWESEFAALTNADWLHWLTCYIFTRDSSYCFHRVLAIAILSVRLSVCPSVSHTGGSVKSKGRLEILSTYFFCQKFAAVCQKMATSCSSLFNRRRRWLCSFFAACCGFWSIFAKPFNCRLAICCRLQSLNSILILLFIPLFEFVVYPLTDKFTEPRCV